MTGTWGEDVMFNKLILELIYNGIKYMFYFFVVEDVTGNRYRFDKLSCIKVYWKLKVKCVLVENKEQ